MGKAYQKKKAKLVVRKTTHDEEQRLKDVEFLKLKPIERLRVHEAMRKKIWGANYYTTLKGSKVIRKSIFE